MTLRIPTILLAAAMAVPAAAQEGEAPLGWAMLPAIGPDADGDGVYEVEEFGRRAPPPEFDVDGDGAFTVVEISQGYFALYDADDSGYLEQDELRAMEGLARLGLYRMDL